MKTNQSLMALFVDNYIYAILDIFPLFKHGSGNTQDN